MQGEPKKRRLCRKGPRGAGFSRRGSEHRSTAQFNSAIPGLHVVDSWSRSRVGHLRRYTNTRRPVPRLSLHGPRPIARRGDEMSQSRFPGQPEHMPSRTSEPRRLTRSWLGKASRLAGRSISDPMSSPLCTMLFLHSPFATVFKGGRVRSLALFLSLLLSFAYYVRGRCVALTDTGSGPLHASQPRSGRMGPRRQGPGGSMARPEYGSSPAGRASGECDFTSRSIAVVSVPKYHVDLTRDDVRTISDSIC